MIRDAVIRQFGKRKALGRIGNQDVDQAYCILVKVFRCEASEAFDFTALAFFIEAAGFGGDAGAGFYARPGFMRGLAQQVDQAQQGVGAVLLLRAVLSRFDDQHAIGRQAAARQLVEARFHLFR